MVEDKSAPLHLHNTLERPKLGPAWVVTALVCESSASSECYKDDGSGLSHVARRNFVVGHVFWCSRTGFGFHHSFGIFFLESEHMHSDCKALKSNSNTTKPCTKF
ncbi:hypothetical protein RIF29_10066 [Crotalaria pallida]|uniref:Uncharacterized protein n=1 Tax=Crotalaria pallida TaxID=3830 RepID=A0AAN9FSE8_CROPI